MAYNPDEPRDYHGRWTSGGGEDQSISDKNFRLASPHEIPAEASKWRSATPEEFIAARNKSTRLDYMSPLKPADLKDHQLYMNHEGTVGVAIAKDGDIQNLFNNDGPKGAGVEALKWAIANGGYHLDCYAPYLPGLYKTVGFVETSKVKFDPQYAPPNWNYEKFNHPDVVFMKLSR